MVICYRDTIIIVNSRTEMDHYRNNCSLDQNFFSVTVKTVKQMAVIAGVFTMLWLLFIALSLYLLVNSNTVQQQRKLISPIFEAFRLLAFVYPAIDPILCCYYVNSLQEAMHSDAGSRLKASKKPRKRAKSIGKFAVFKKLPTAVRNNENTNLPSEKSEISANNTLSCYHSLSTQSYTF